MVCEGEGSRNSINALMYPFPVLERNNAATYCWGEVLAIKDQRDTNNEAMRKRNSEL